MSSALLRLAKPPDSGPKVRGLQERLKALGYDPGTIDGVFGPSTERAVKQFQHDHALPADGVVGPATKAPLAGPPRQSQRGCWRPTWPTTESPGWRPAATGRACAAPSTAG